MNEKQIVEARKIVGQNLGLKDFDGTAESYKALSQKKQIQLTENLAKFIKENPDTFTAGQLAIADKIVSGENFGTPLQDVSFGASVDEFKKEFVAEGEKLAKNAGFGFSTALGVGVAIVSLLALAPQAIRFVQSLAKK